jgi:uncharacterized protein YodC (DUF2158 family)
MTVEDVRPGGTMAACFWFVTGRADCQTFPVADLQVIRQSLAPCDFPPIGATVRLRSGGPPMKVISGDGVRVRAEFLTPELQLVSAYIRPESFQQELQPAVPAEPPAVATYLSPFKVGDRVKEKHPLGPAMVGTVTRVIEDQIYTVTDDGRNAKWHDASLCAATWRDEKPLL